MHPQSPALHIGGTVLMDSDDLHVLGVTFDPMMFLRKSSLGSRTISQRLEEVLHGEFSVIGCFLRGDFRVL